MSGHVGDDVSVASDIDAYKESYFTHTPDTSKHNHLHPKELKTVVPKGVPPPTISVGPKGIILYRTIIYYSSLTMFLVLIRYVHLANVGV